MAKIYVQIIPVVVKIDDSKLKTAVADRIKKAFEAAIEASGSLTKKPPANAKEKGFALDINFSTKATGKEIACDLNIVFSYRPKKAIFGSAKKGGIITSLQQINELLDLLLDDLVPAVIAKLKAQIPKLADV